jgi:predicted GIY-YIG superfamily endonuclease
LKQHQNGEGADYTKKYLPVELVYFEEFQRIDEAFYREKQVQGWNRKKKEALINGTHEKLPDLSKNHSQFRTSGEDSKGISTKTVAEPVETTDKEGISTGSMPAKVVAELVEATRRKGISTSSMPEKTVVETCPEQSRRAVETTDIKNTNII